MKSPRPLPQELVTARWACLLPCLAAATLSGAETNGPPAVPAAPPALTPQQMFEGGSESYNNWVQVSAGGFLTSGSVPQFQQQHQTSNGAFGGIESLHFQGEVATNTTFTVDGRSIFDNHDYDLRLGLAKEKLGYVRFSFSEFRNWSDGDGGFYSPNGAYNPLSDDALNLDRGVISFEAGLTLEKIPKIIFKYTHSYRDGEKGSTSWGYTHPDSTELVRGIAPSFWDLNEASDAFQLDASHHIKATDFGVGIRYEFGKLNDALKINQFPGEPVAQKLTEDQGTTYDLFNAHAYSETWLKKNLMFSAGVSFSDLDNDFTGSRIYGTDFDVNYVPSAQSGMGYYALNGVSHLTEYVGDLNLFYKPTPFLAIVPSLRVMKEDWDAQTTGVGTLADNPTSPFDVNSQRGVLDVRERLDVRYSAITNWVLFARGEWTESDGNLNESGGLSQVNGFGPPPIDLQTDDSRFFQKYSAGARWYLSRGVTLDAGGYYKLDDYSYNNLVDSTANNSFDRYPGYLVMQDFATYDGNVRLTLRPRANISLVSRYEYQSSSIHTKPDPISGLGEVESSDMTSHILAQDVTWTPWSRLFLQAGFNYVASETKTPASEVTQAILNAQNNYWTLNFSSGFVVNDKTDFNVAYFYYRADDFQDNATLGLPLGAGGEEHAVTATLIRRISQHVRLTLRYGFYHYTDQLYGGNRDFDTHMVYSSLQYRF
jgi:hypothetical protein